MGAMPEEATLVSVPPYHIAGISAVMSSIYACRRQVQLANFDAETWVRLCKDEGVTNAFVVPTMLTRIIDVLDEQDDAQAAFPQLAAIAYGGGKMPVPVIERALKLLPDVNFTNAYGLTETSSTITLLDPNDHREAISDTNLRQRLGSVGKALPSIELEIRDEDGQAVSAGTPGEIYVRGPQVSGEYDGRSVLDSEGWFPTRDAGYLDEGVSFPLWTGRRRYCPRRRKHLPRRNRGSATRPGRCRGRSCRWHGIRGVGRSGCPSTGHENASD